MESGLRALVVTFGSAGALVGATYALGWQDLQPWRPGQPLPVVSRLLPQAGGRVEETESGELVQTAAAPAMEAAVAVAVAAPGGTEASETDMAAAEAAAALAAAKMPLPEGLTAEVLAQEAAEPEEAVPVPEDPSSLAARLPKHPPGVPTPLVDEGYKGMAPFFRALAQAEAGQGVARASHWGDSTIAADGITRTVRARLQDRFGAAGPGFVFSGVDPAWNLRADLTWKRSGSWKRATILQGEGKGRHGFGGMMATASAGASLLFTWPKEALDTSPLLGSAELYLQAGPGRGRWWAEADGVRIGEGDASAAAIEDRFERLEVPAGYRSLKIGAEGGSVPYYGVVMETASAGVVWDALGVVGVGSLSFRNQNAAHLSAQVAHRKPDLIVFQIGGNEVGIPVLFKKDGSRYMPYYLEALQKVRAGAPDAGCLIITPLDQGTRDGGAARTKPTLKTMVLAQRKIAAQEGCAFWDAFSAMGGEGSIVRWSQKKLAWSDLLHLSTRGAIIVGDLLSDAILASYDDWKSKGGQ